MNRYTVHSTQMLVVVVVVVLMVAATEASVGYGVGDGGVGDGGGGGDACTLAYDRVHVSAGVKISVMRLESEKLRYSLPRYTLI